MRPLAACDEAGVLVLCEAGAVSAAKANDEKPNIKANKAERNMVKNPLWDLVGRLYEPTLPTGTYSTSDEHLLYF